MNNQPQEYQEIDLHRAISALIEKKWLISGIVLLGAALALALSFVLPKVYRVESSMEIGFIVDSEKPRVIESPIQLKEKLDQDVYGQQAREQLKISQKDYPKIKIKNLNDTNVLSFSADSSKPEQAKKIFETLNALILAKHDSEIKLMKKDIESRIDIEKKNIERIQNKAQSLEREKSILENKIAILQQLNIENPDPGTQFVLLDTKEQLEAKKRETESLYQDINSSQATINSLQIKDEQSRSTSIIKEPAISERPVSPRSLLNTLLGALLGFLAGATLVFCAEWWKNYQA